jgi:hypothetical protein
VLLGWVKVNPEWISSRIPLLQVLLKAQPRWWWPKTSPLKSRSSQVSWTSAGLERIR